MNVPAAGVAGAVVGEDPRRAALVEEVDGEVDARREPHLPRRADPLAHRAGHRVREDDERERVDVTASAPRRLYRLRPEPLREIDEWLTPYRAAWRDRLDSLEHHLDAMAKAERGDDLDDADLGELDRSGERWRLRFVRRLPHPPDLVWRAVTDPEHLAAWFPQEIVGERRAGAVLRFVTGGDVLRIEVAPDADGAGTVLTLIDTFTALGKAARDAAGWHECVERLGCVLDRRTPPPLGETWKAVHPLYVERFGPEAATIGPPEGWDD